VAAQQKIQDDFAKEQGATKAAVRSEREINAQLARQNASLAAFVAVMKKQSKGSTVASSSTGTATIAESSKGTLTPETPTSPAFCTDAFGTIKVNTRDCSFQVNMPVRVAAVAVRGLDGKTQFTKQRIELLDPVSGYPIPGTGTDLKIVDFAVTEDKGPEPGPFHLRAVAGVNERGAFGAGVKFWSWKSLDASAMGFYDRADKSVRGAVGLGYRLVLPAFNSTLSIGPHWGIDTKGKSALGAAATIELTR